jgi:hypothetical protein
MNFANFDTNGYQIIRGVLNPDEVYFATKLFEDWYKRNEVDSRNSPHGVIQHYGAGHSAFAWYTRTRPRVIQVFKDLWKTNDLVVSFDGQGYWSGEQQKKNTTWLHIDQRLDEPQFKCAQGLVSYTNNNGCGLMLIPGSHKIIEGGYFQNYEGDKTKRFNKIEKPEDFGQPIVINLNAGDMVIWDSRVVHQNWYLPQKRLVQYVSYLPKSGLSEGQAQKREKYYIEKRSTSHWAYPVQVNGLQPQTYGQRPKLDYTKIGESNRGESWLRKNRQNIKNLIY